MRNDVTSGSSLPASQPARRHRCPSQAGRVLQEERDALARLVASLQASSSSGIAGRTSAGGALQDATNSPGAAASLAPAACALDGRLQQYRVTPAGIQSEGGTSGGIGAAWPPAAPRAGSRPASPGAAAAARNKLLVRQGSSFNAMVRALKQDLVGTGALARAGPAAALEIDKVRRWGRLCV